MSLVFAALVLSSLALLVLNGRFEPQVRARHPELLPALRLDDQGALTNYARWRFSLLPYSRFILRREFVSAFQNEADLRKLSEVIFWVHVVQVAAFATFVMGIVIGGIGTIAVDTDAQVRPPLRGSCSLCAGQLQR